MKREDVIKLINSVLMDKDTDAWQYGEFGKLAPAVLEALETNDLIIHYDDTNTTDYSTNGIF